MHGIVVNKNNVWLGASQFKDEILNAQIGFHSFTGNYYVPQYFRKGKQACWKVFTSDSKFQTFLSALGACAELSQEMEEWKNLYAAYMAFEKST